MADDVFRIDADFSDLNDALSALEKQLKNYGQVVKSVTEVHSEFDKEGNVVRTLEAVSTTGNKVIGTVVSAGNSLKVLNVELRTAAEDADLAAKSMAEYNAAINAIRPAIADLLQKQREEAAEAERLHAAMLQINQSYRDALEPLSRLSIKHKELVDNFYEVRKAIGSTGGVIPGVTHLLGPDGKPLMPWNNGFGDPRRTGLSFTDRSGFKDTSGSIDSSVVSLRAIRSDGFPEESPEEIAHAAKQRETARISAIIAETHMEAQAAEEQKRIREVAQRQLQKDNADWFALINDKDERGAKLVEKQLKEAEKQEKAHEEAILMDQKRAYNIRLQTQQFMDSEMLAEQKKAHEELLAEQEKHEALVERKEKEAARLRSLIDANHLGANGKEMFGPFPPGGGKPPSGFGTGFAGAFPNFSSQAIGTFAGNAAFEVVNAFGAELKQSINDAIEFERRIARLQVTQRDTALSAHELGNEVLRLSSSFNLDKMDVAQARFDAMSKGVIKSAQAEEYLNSTLALAQVTSSSAADATNAVSAAINAFGLKADDAAHVSEVMFRLFKEGGVNINFLDDTMGRLGAVASPLGFKLEDVGAILTTFTRRGISASESASTLSNWFQRLAAPTPELTAKIRELGFATSEEAIKSGHMADILRLLSHEAGLSSENITKLLGGIRTSRGALGEVGFFEEAIKGAQALRAENGQLVESLKKVQETGAEKMTQSFLELRNALTQLGVELVDLFGPRLSKVVDDLSKKIKQLDSNKPSDKGGFLLGNLDPTGTLEKILGFEFEKAKDLFGAVRKKLFGGEDKDAFSPMEQRRFDEIENGREEERRGGRFRLPTVERAILEMLVNETNETIKKLDTKSLFQSAIQPELDALNKRRAAYESYRDKQVAIEKEITAQFKGELAVRMSRYEDHVRLLNDAANKARDIRRASVERVEDSNETFAEARYSRQFSLLTPDQQAYQLRSSIRGLNLPAPYLGPMLGNRNLISEHLASLQSDRDTHFSNLATKQGDAFLGSRDLEKAQKDSTEIGKILQQQFDLIAQDYKSGKASMEDVLTAERQMTAEKEKQDELERSLQAAMEEKEKSTKAAADTEKVRNEQIKVAADAALNVQVSDKMNRAQALEAAKKFEDEALGKAKDTSEYAALKTLFENKNTQLNREGDLLEGGRKFSDNMESILKEVAKFSGAKDLSDHFSEYKKQAHEDMQKLIDLMSAAMTPGGNDRKIFSLTKGAEGQASGSGGVYGPLLDANGNKVIGPDGKVIMTSRTASGIKSSYVESDNSALKAASDEKAKALLNAAHERQMLIDKGQPHRDFLGGGNQMLAGGLIAKMAMDVANSTFGMMPNYQMPGSRATFTNLRANTSDFYSIPNYTQEKSQGNVVHNQPVNMSIQGANQPVPEVTQSIIIKSLQKAHRQGLIRLVDNEGGTLTRVKDDQGNTSETYAK